MAGYNKSMETFYWCVPSPYYWVLLKHILNYIMYLFASIHVGYKKVYDWLESYVAALFVNKNSSNIKCINDIFYTF